MRLQSIESAARSAFLGALTRVAGAVGSAPLPDWKSRPYRLLFLRDDGIGDMILSLEVMRAIAESSPTFTFDVLASPQNASLAQGLPWIHDVLVHQRGSLIRSWPLRRELRRRRYDVVIDGRVAMGSINTQTTFILLSTRAPWRVGIAGRRNDQVYSVPITAGELPHQVDYLAALGAPFGVARARADWHPRVRLPDADRAAAERRWTEWGSGTPRVLMNITARQPDHWWPEERYAALLSRLRMRLPSANIAVLAMRQDRGIADRLAAGVSAAATTLSVPETIASVATADFVVTPDTAIAHIASAFERPTLTLQRKGAERWVPFGTPGKNVYSDEPRRLASLPQARAIAALDEVISELGPSRGWIGVGR